MDGNGGIFWGFVSLGKENEIPQLPEIEDSFIAGEYSFNELADLIVMTPRNVQLLNKQCIFVKVLVNSWRR